MKIQQRTIPDVQHNLDSFSPLLQRLLLSRGISNCEQLDFKLSRLLSPLSMKGIESASRLLADAVQHQKRILVVGDFDADGATSTALTLRCLKAFGHGNVSYLVPNRFEFGYGLSPAIVREAVNYQPDLIMTVDNGISSIEGVAEANRLGIQVVVTDHHLAGEQLPKAAAIVNPNQPGCEFASKAMAGVGVAFYTMLALRKVLRDSGWFVSKGIEEPNMSQFLDLVAVGTVSDLVPLDNNNRIMVAMGLERIRSGRAIPGIYALLQVAKRLPKNLTSTDIGFAIGPRINAAGRLDDMSEGIECLLCDDPNQALELAAHLDSLNRGRKEIELGMKEEAERYVDSLVASKGMPKGIVVYQADWHEGVIGIVASRIKERFYRPVIAFAEANDGIKGSARSIPGLHMRDCLDLVDKQNPGLIKKFGGHAMAAGLTIELGAVDKFQQALNYVLERHFQHVDFQKILQTDGALSAQEMTLSNAELLAMSYPWGQQFPEPLFEGVFKVDSICILNGGHIKWTLLTEAGELVDAIYFNVKAPELFESLLQVRLCYRLAVNEFRDRRSLQLMVEYAEKLA
ncbi:single-stranded-DNA-specific exonuclease RecJ [Litoribrevibacter euphylliae]|uniref:Single-stranded-DNA-specific exonuclease RecJ n=1 Tax=Litoribrevibacter euphylliae TaxID=1834034 RepID=A0ABV7HAX9_9GAMM